MAIAVAVPNDTTNEARALLLLEAAGIITVNHDKGLQATARDITGNPKKIKVKELEAAQISRSLPDVNLAVINGNYAIEAGLSASRDALKSEDKGSLAAQTFANIVVIRQGDESRPEIKALEEAITSEARSQVHQRYVQGGGVARLLTRGNRLPGEGFPRHDSLHAPAGEVVDERREPPRRLVHAHHEHPYRPAVDVLDAAVEDIEIHPQLPRHP